MTLPTGQTTTYEYDTAGQKLAEVDGIRPANQALSAYPGLMTA